MLVTSTSCSGAPRTVTLPPHSQMLFKTLSPGPSWRSSPASSWERAAQCRDLHASTTQPTLASDCAQKHPDPSGIGCPPLLPPVSSAEGLALLRAGCPLKGTHGVGGTTQSWAHRSWTAACLSKARVQALAQLGLCSLPSPPVDMPAAARRHRRLAGRPAGRVSAQTHPHAAGRSRDLISG